MISRVAPGWKLCHSSFVSRFIIGAPTLCVLQVQGDVQMKFFIELLNGDRTHPNTCHRCNLPYLRVPGTASTDCILPRFSPLFVHNTKTKLEFYRHQSCTPQQGVKALVCWATGKRLTNRLPKLSLITLSPPLNSGILGLRMGLYVPTPMFFHNLWGPRESDSSDS